MMPQVIITRAIQIMKDEAEAMIMQARVKAGWITEADLVKPEPETEEGEAVEAEPERA